MRLLSALTEIFSLRLSETIKRDRWLNTTSSPAHSLAHALTPSSTCSFAHPLTHSTCSSANNILEQLPPLPPLQLPVRDIGVSQENRHVSTCIGVLNSIAVHKFFVLYQGSDARVDERRRETGAGENASLENVGPIQVSNQSYRIEAVNWRAFR